MRPTFFATPAHFRVWLQEHHARAKELIVGFYKKDSGQPSITWPESVDEALCFGWIDGIRRRYDDHAYTIRFTPRRPGSIWSAINIGRVAVLKKEKRMRPAGLAAFARRKEYKSRVYSYEQKGEAAFEPAFERRFRANKAAWAFFERQAPYYRRGMARWIGSGKTAETRRRRLDKLVAACQSGRRLLP